MLSTNSLQRNSMNRKASAHGFPQEDEGQSAAGSWGTSRTKPVWLHLCWQENCGAQREIVNGAWEGKATVLRKQAAWGTSADVQKQSDKVVLHGRAACALHGAPLPSVEVGVASGEQPSVSKMHSCRWMGTGAPARILYRPALHLWTHTVPPTAISASSTRDKELIIGFISRKTSEVKESFSQQQAFSLQWPEVILRTHFLAHHNKIISRRIAHWKQLVWLGVLEVLPCDASLLRGCRWSWDIQHKPITSCIFSFWASGEVSVFSWRTTCCIAIAA